MPIMVKDGKILVVDGKIAASQNCCCSCCTNGDTEFEENATISVTEDGGGSGPGAYRYTVDAPNLEQTSCGVFSGPGTFTPNTTDTPEDIGYTATYNGDGTWNFAFDNVTDPEFSNISIPATGGTANVPYTGAGGESFSSTVTVVGDATCDDGGGA